MLRLTQRGLFKAAETKSHKADMNEEQLKALFAQLLGPVTTQMSDLAAQFQAFKAQAPVQTPPVQPPPAPAPVQPPPAPAPVQPPPAPAPGTSSDPAINAALAEMRRAREEDKKAIEALTKDRDAAKAAADKAAQDAVVEKALGDFAFRSQSAKDTAVQLLNQHIKRNEAGQLIAGDNLTVDAFVADFIPKQHDYLLAPVNSGGSGVNPGATQYAGGKPVDTKDINPQMSAETKEAAWAAVRSAAHLAQNGL